MTFGITTNTTCLALNNIADFIQFRSMKFAYFGKLPCEVCQMFQTSKCFRMRVNERPMVPSKGTLPTEFKNSSGNSGNVT